MDWGSSGKRLAGIAVRLHAPKQGRLGDRKGPVPRQLQIGPEFGPLMKMLTGMFAASYVPPMDVPWIRASRLLILKACPWGGTWR